MQRWSLLRLYVSTNYSKIAYTALRALMIKWRIFSIGSPAADRRRPARSKKQILCNSLLKKWEDDIFFNLKIV
jgi:hypothetical protein